MFLKYIQERYTNLCNPVYNLEIIFLGCGTNECFNFTNCIGHIDDKYILKSYWNFVS